MVLFEEFEKGVSLRDLVAEILREGPRSISQVGRALKERGLKIHRLAVAGYLKALADSGFLEEREIPPSKTYSLKPATSKKDLYQVVADASRDQAGGPIEAGRLYLGALSELLRRPIFLEEFRRVGIGAPAGAQEVTGEERQNVRRFLSKSPLKLPFNDPAYEPKWKDDAEAQRYRDAARAVLSTCLRDELRAGALAVTTRQSTLGAGA